MLVVDDERRNPYNSVGGDIVMRSFLYGWMSEWVHEWVSQSVRCALSCGHDTDYSFCPITYKLHLHIVEDERRNTIDFESKAKVNFGIRCIKACAWARYRLQLLSNHFQTSHASLVDDERMNSIGFGFWGSKVKVNFWDSDYKNLLARYRLQFLPNHFQN